ncbi:hypothetical protein Bbelb_300610 [Branchiostoma belcheri]|nr:hypothetical protein Bbelb_300610 [Branchiostoma belcheri]
MIDTEERCPQTASCGEIKSSLLSPTLTVRADCVTCLRGALRDSFSTSISGPSTQEKFSSPSQTTEQIEAKFIKLPIQVPCLYFSGGYPAIWRDDGTTRPWCYGHG